MEWIANMDLSGYQNQSGLTAIINRLEVHYVALFLVVVLFGCLINILFTFVGNLQQEIKECQPFHGAILSSDLPSPPSNQEDSVAMETSENQGTQENATQSHQSDDAPPQSEASEEVPMETEQPETNTAGVSDNNMEVDEQEIEKGKAMVDASVAGPSSAPNPVSKNRCLPQRAALIKAVLSFLKKSIPDPSFSESIRNGKYYYYYYYCYCYYYFNRNNKCIF